MANKMIPIAILAMATSANAAVVGIDQVYNLPGDQQIGGIAVIDNTAYSGRAGNELVFDKNDLTAGPTGSITGVTSNDATGIGDRLYWLSSGGTVQATDLTGNTVAGKINGVPNDTIALGSAKVNGTEYITATNGNGFTVYDTVGNLIQPFTNFSQAVSNMTGGDAWAPANATSLSDLLVFASDDSGTIRVFDGAGQFMEEYNTLMSDTADVEFDGQRFYGNTSVSPLPFVPSEVYRTDAITAIPEPTSIAMGLGMGSLALARRGRRKD